MKKAVSLVLTALLLALATGASAQVRFGVVGGITSSTSNVKDFKASSVSLYHVGATLKVPLGGFLALQPSLLYHMKGAALDDILGNASNAKFETKTGYVEVPLQIQAGMKIGPVRPYVFGEPFIGFGLTNKSSETLQQTLENKWEDANINRWEYGLGLGAGVELLGHIQLSAKYFWNFGSLVNDENKISASAIGETVRYAFKDGKNFNGLTISLALLF
ncbi:MAG: PorT family protein [Bacteroidales bacterium]|nr:PorT family protein [Bacteroidales bacterium]